MDGIIGEIKVLQIEVIKDGKQVYKGIGSNVPEEYKVKFNTVKTNHEGIIYYI